MEGVTSEPSGIQPPLKNRESEIDPDMARDKLLYVLVMGDKFDYVKWYLGGFKIQRPWKRGPKKDRIRINRVRALKPHYNYALDIPEIFNKIMDYLDHTDPMDAINFSRAIETLGSEANLEGLYLLKKHKEWGYTDRVSLGLLRCKIAKAKHCRRCGERSNTYGYGSSDSITTTPLCWICLNLRFALISKTRAKSFMENAVDPMMPPCLIKMMLKPNQNEMISVNGISKYIRNVKYRQVRYYLKSDVKEFIKEWQEKERESIDMTLEENSECVCGRTKKLSELVDVK